MKFKTRLLFGFTMAATAAMVGCESTPAVDNTGGNTDDPNTGGEQTETTTASISATLATALINTDEAATRVAIEEASEVAAKLLWSKGDVINLFDAEGEAVEYKTTTSGTSSKATFKGDEVEMDSAWALYSSADATVDYDAKTIATTIATAQTYDPADEFGIEAGVLTAVAVGDEDNEDFSFKSVAGVFAMNLTGSGIVKSIEVKAADSEKIAGDVVISMDGTPAISSANESTITLNCGEGVELGAVAKNFSVVVAPTTSALSFTVTLSDDTTVEFTSTEGVSRNEITKCTAQIGEVGSEDPDGPSTSGGLAVNGDFESDEEASIDGIAEFTYSEIYDGKDAPIDGNSSRFLKITNNGDGSASVQAHINFNFPMPFTATDEYVIKFKACSDQSSMELTELGAWGNGEWRTGVMATPFTLTETWKDITVKVENKGWWEIGGVAGSDLFVGTDKIAINFGLSAGAVVYIDDVVIEKAGEGSVTPPTGDGSLFNGDFETGEIDSSVDGYAENTSCELVDGSVNPVDGNETFFLKATNNGDGSNGMGARINFHLPSPLAADSEYVLTFKACTDIDALVLKEIGLWGNGGWLTGTFMSEFTLDKTWKEVSFKIENKGWWNADAFVGSDMVEFRFGTYAGASLYIDDAVLSIPEAPVVTPGKEIMSDPGLDGMWVNAQNAGTTGFYVGTQDDDKKIYGSVAKAAGADGGAALKIVSDGVVGTTEDSHRIHVQIKPGECGTGFSVFEKGKKYKVSFDLKSDNATEIFAENAIIQNSSWENFASFTGGENIVTTTDWQTFSYDIIPNDENNYAGACYIVLQLAYYTDSFYIDNISLKEIE